MREEFIEVMQREGHVRRRLARQWADILAARFTSRRPELAARTVLNVGGRLVIRKRHDTAT
jgi:hypothetical protein